MNKSNNKPAGANGSRANGASKQKQPRRAPPRPRADLQLSTGRAQPPFRGVPATPGEGKQASVAAAYSTGQRVNAPRIMAGRDQVRIVHRELVASVTGSVAFTVARQLALNPGLPASFPWLSSQAQAWERYRFNRLRFCYYTRTGSNVPGSVQMVPDYDAADAAPSSEQIASSYQDVEEDAPWKDIKCDLRPEALHAIGPTKFIRTGSLAANQDVKTYDAGNFFLCTIDGTAVPWGKLWVEYDVLLYTPQLNPAGGGTLAAISITSASPSSTEILPAPQVVKANSASFASVANEVITFSEAGQYMYSLLTQGTTVTQTAAPVVSVGSSFLTGPGQGGSGTASCCQSGRIQMAVGGTLTFDNTIAAGTSATLSIAKVPSNLA